MRLYHKFVEFLSKILSFIAIATMLAMLILMIIEVIRRYIFGVTFPWSDEVIRLLLVFGAYFGGAVAFKNGGLVCFDLLTQRLPRRVQDVILLINNVIMNVFFVFMIYTVSMKMVSPAVTKSISTATGLTGAVPYYGILVGLVFLVLFCIDFYPGLIDRALHGQKEEKEGDA